MPLRWTQAPQSHNHPCQSLIVDERMESGGRISQYRNRLDKTLASPHLTNADTLKSLIKTHLLSTTLTGAEECSEGLLEKRTSEVSNFLDMLRSASVKTEGTKAAERSHAEWKLKQDNEEFRVMYREGPPGSPFHTLLVEGYIDGPIDACLCVSWESSLYKKWWPQYHVPTFKIVSSHRLLKLRIGDEISLVRVKVSWPLSTREALVQFFVFEYFQDEMIIVLMNTVNESENIDISTHGYNRDMIPEAKDVVRIGTVGGFALQKVNTNRSYFRTIANVDLKLDFVPPSLINFISRQLIGSGFKLYQKAISTVFSSDEEFKKALGGPLYSRIRDALYCTAEHNLKLEDKVPMNDEDGHEGDVGETSIFEVIQEHRKEMAGETIEKILIDQSEGQITASQNISTASCEIEEEGTEDSRSQEGSHGRSKKRDYISPEVEEALGTLDNVIAAVREYGWNAHSRSHTLSGKDAKCLEDAKTEKSTLAGGIVSSGHQSADQISKKDIGERHLDEMRDSSNDRSLRSKKSNSLREVNHNKVAPASPLENLMVPSLVERAAPYTTENGKTEELSHIMNGSIIKTGEETKENGLKGRKKSRNRWKYSLWCFRFHPCSRQSVA
ncbi:hypothetical protein SAY86_030589 [Trapa natans]|uniref:START domain-containing protein n=1 Tax=Trapa natans TaxID=22666 RepID=A0AAN7MSG4_TRANT|nr:hypothetical protein SAY86_030589 [Trapa natans]